MYSYGENVYERSRHLYNDYINHLDDLPRYHQEINTSTIADQTEEFYEYLEQERVTNNITSVSAGVNSHSFSERNVPPVNNGGGYFARAVSDHSLHWETSSSPDSVKSTGFFSSCFSCFSCFKTDDKASSMTASNMDVSSLAPREIFADASALTEAKDTESYSALLSKIELVDSSAINAFKRQSNETLLAHAAFDDLVQSSLPSAFRNATLSGDGEVIKNLLGMISPHISTQKDKNKFNEIIQTLTKANGDEAKEQVVGEALAELVISCGKPLFEACLAKFYALCVEAWKAAHPDIQGDMTHDRVFNEQSPRIFSMLDPIIKEMTKSSNNLWGQLAQQTEYLRDSITALSKTIRPLEAPKNPQPANQVPNPEHPAVMNTPSAGLGGGMNGWPGIHFAPVVHGGNGGISTGGHVSITGGNYPLGNR